MTIDDVVKDIESASFDIPFENSKFQTDKFVVAGQITPARAYRAILLRLSNRLRALNEVKFSRAKEQIDIEELEEKSKVEFEKPAPNNFDIRRWQLEIQQKEANRNYTDKLIHDAIVEVEHLYSLMLKFKRYTREEFELEEERHFQLSLTRQVQGIAGAAASLIDMSAKEGIPLGVDTELLSIIETPGEQLVLE